MKNYYAVRDSKAGTFQKPFQEFNDATAIRTFQTLVNDETQGNLFASNPEDFALFKIATYDEIKGEFTNDQKHIVKLYELKRRDK